MRTRKKYEITITEKQCFCCKETKSAENFPKNSQLIGGLHTWCKLCVSKKHKEANYDLAKKVARKKKMEEDPVFKEHILKQKRESRKRNIITSLLTACRYRAIQKGLEFSLVREDIVIPEVCPILLKPIICGDKNDYSFSPSVDRIDNNKGYTKDNIQVISMKANKMKNNATEEELINFANWILK